MCTMDILQYTKMSSNRRLKTHRYSSSTLPQPHPLAQHIYRRPPRIQLINGCNIRIYECEPYHHIQRYILTSLTCSICNPLRRLVLVFSNVEFVLFIKLCFNNICSYCHLILLLYGDIMSIKYALCEVAAD